MKNLIEVQNWGFFCLGEIVSLTDLQSCIHCLLLSSRFGFLLYSILSFLNQTQILENTSLILRTTHALLILGISLNPVHRDINENHSNFPETKNKKRW